MSSAQKDSLTASKSGLKPSILNDTSGPYIVVTCGSFTGQLYISKLDQSKGYRVNVLL